MPVSRELLSALRAYERLWRSDAADADLEQVHLPPLRGDRVCEHWLQVDLLGLLNQLQP